jgi:hypothetical protein
VRLREEVEEEERLTAGGRGVDSELGESGDFEVLVEPEGALRLPERRVSLGERGGPISDTWAMNRGEVDKKEKARARDTATRKLANATKGFTSLGLAQSLLFTLFPSLSHRLTHTHLATRQRRIVNAWPSKSNGHLV